MSDVLEPWCKNCKMWFRQNGKLALEWNLCQILHQNTVDFCYIIPLPIEELRDSSRVRTCTTYKDFGCRFYTGRVDCDNEKGMPAGISQEMWLLQAEAEMEGRR